MKKLIVYFLVPSFIYLTLGVVGTGIAQESKLNSSEICDETQKMSDNPDDMTIVWWIPDEFWIASAAEDASFLEADLKAILKTFQPYELFGVMDGEIGYFGGVTYKSEADIRNSIRLVCKDGTLIYPTATEKIDNDTKALLAFMKPALENMMGEMGKNMYFFLFPAKNKNGQMIAEAKKEGLLHILLGEREFKWRLPLDSVMPLKICSNCGEKCKGSWKFCPWCGTKLSINRKL